MGVKQTLGLLGSSLLFVGVFTPILSIPIIGSLNYIQNGREDGIAILVMGIVSFVMVLKKLYQALWVPGIVSICVISFTFIKFKVTFSNARSQMETELLGNPYRTVAEMIAQSVQLQWGWAVLITGAALIVTSAAIINEKESNI